MVLDESSVIKHHTSKTLQALLDAFSRTPYRLCATATPAPNDWTELARTPSSWASARGQKCWQSSSCTTAATRRHGASRAMRGKIFWRWVASWGVMLRSPADLGHDASAYNLPPLSVHQHTVASDHSQEETGYLFAMEAADPMEAQECTQGQLAARVSACTCRDRERQQ